MLINFTRFCSWKRHYDEMQWANINMFTFLKYSITQTSRYIFEREICIWKCITLFKRSQLLNIYWKLHSYIETLHFISRRCETILKSSGICTEIIHKNVIFHWYSSEYDAHYCSLHNAHVLIITLYWKYRKLYRKLRESNARRWNNEQEIISLDYY